MKQLLTPILYIIAITPLASAAEIRTATDKFDDTVSGIRKVDGKLVLFTQGGKSSPLEKVKEIRFSDKQAAKLHDAHLYLLSGDEVVGTVGDEVKSGESFKLSTVSLGNVEVNLDALAAVLFDVPADKEEPFARKRFPWLQGKGARPKHDSFTLRGEKAGAEGTVQSFSKEGLVFKDVADTVWPSFPLRRVESLVLGGEPAKPRPAGVRILLRMGDGSILTGAVVKLEDQKLQIEHALGKNGPLTLDLSQVLSLEVLGGAFVYLSDLTPDAVEEKFPEGFERDAETWTWKRDREVTGNPLKLGNHIYPKGIGVQSYSSLTFALDGSFRELRLVVGIDDSTKYLGSPGLGSVTFRVLLDGKVAKEIKKARGDAPDEVAVPLGGAKKLALVADYGTYFHILGRADWADACLVK